MCADHVTDRARTRIPAPTQTGSEAELQRTPSEFDTTRPRWRAPLSNTTPAAWSGVDLGHSHQTWSSTSSAWASERSPGRLQQCRGGAQTLFSSILQPRGSSPAGEGETPTSTAQGGTFQPREVPHRHGRGPLLNPSSRLAHTWAPSAGAGSRQPRGLTNSERTHSIRPCEVTRSGFVSKPLHHPPPRSSPSRAVCITTRPNLGRRPAHRSCGLCPDSSYYADRRSCRVAS